MTTPLHAGPFAAVDLGSNSFHMVIARVVDGHMQVMDRMRERVQLAAGLVEGGALTPEAEARALACLERFGQRLLGMPSESVRAVGTNTFRVAQDAREFLHRAEGVLGHSIDIIPGSEEARILFRGVAHDLPALEGPRLVVDIGGGSTECILGSGEEAQRMNSLQMGCVAFTERFFGDGKITRERFKRASLGARLELEPLERTYRRAGYKEAVGSSGTITAIEAMLRAMPGSYDGITLAGIKTLRDAMISQGSVDRMDLPGLSPERRSVIVGGLSILHAIFKSFDVPRMRASKSALREGLLLELVGRLSEEDIRERTVSRLCERYAVDREQSARVEAMALGLGRQLRLLFALSERELRLLSWAARLHELGQAVSFGGYHRHGAYLLANSDLPGFSELEQAYLAALVGTHRRRLDPGKLQQLRQLDGERAVRMAMLLRLAVRINRGRSAEPAPVPVVRVLGPMLELEFPEGFIDARPMTRADFDAERELLLAASVELVAR